MCVICDNNYTYDIEYLNISNCKTVCYIPNTLINLKHINCEYTKIKNIPKEFTNLIILNCKHSNITNLPNTLIKLEDINCNNTVIKEIPAEFINLKRLYICHTDITNIPNELIKLEKLFFLYTNISTIPKKLINLTNLCVGARRNVATIVRQKKIKNGFIQFIKLYKRYKLFIQLWKIAEYYTAKKYHPNNILKYITLI